MPNHFHGIIFIVGNVGADTQVCPDGGEDPRVPKGEHVGSSLPRSGAPLSQMIQWFKTMTTNEYIRGVKQLHWKPFNGKVWQRDYYDHIIRSEQELQQKSDYILDNPSQWDEDKENPEELK